MTTWLPAVVLLVAVLLLPGRRVRLWERAGSRPVRIGTRRPRRQDGGDGGDETEDVLAFLDILAPSLRAGRTPEEAARLACEVVQGSAVVDAIGAAVAGGRSIESVLERQAVGRPDVRLLAHAWALSARTGCPLADAVESSSRAIRAKADHRRRVVTASAGARTTMRILTLLPLGGPVLAAAVGVDPVTAYVTAPAAWLCLAVGAVLVLLGRVWVDRLVASVGRGPVLG